MKKIISLNNDLEKNPWTDLKKFIFYGRKSYSLLCKSDPYYNTLDSLFKPTYSGIEYRGILHRIIKKNTYNNKYTQ